MTDLAKELGLRQPLEESIKEIRRLAEELGRQTTKMSGDPDSQTIYYGQGEKPNLSTETKEETSPSPQTASEEPQSVTPTPLEESKAENSKLNPNSKPFVPPQTSKLNVNATPFIPLQEVFLTEEELVSYATATISKAAMDPSALDPMKDHIIVSMHALGEVQQSTLEEMANEIVELGLSNIELAYTTGRLVEELCNDPKIVIRTLFLKKLNLEAQEAAKKPVEEILGVTSLIAEFYIRILIKGKHMYPLKKALLENLIRLLDSEKEELVQVACRLLKLAGPIIEKATREVEIDKLIKKLQNLKTFSKQTSNLISHIILLRKSNWGYSQQSSAMATEPPHETYVDENGTTFFSVEKTKQLTKDWSEFMDAHGKAYTDLQLDPNEEEQIEIETEYEQFLEDEQNHYAGLFYFLNDEEDDDRDA